MIARLRGVAADVTPDGLVVDVNGVGYVVAPTTSLLRLAAPGKEVTAETYLHVREDTMQLYGFADGQERTLFTQLLGVSGVGPKVALAIVSSAPAAELRRAIALGDGARFQAVPGVGKKTADRIVLELKEKLADAAALPPVGAVTGDDSAVAREALLELGYTIEDAERALATVDPELPPEERVRAVLRSAA